jgi:alkanesulfonate monooxygenase SsuD/methylene tetrahydromethanopterin reductase-like flavin-dependent oxidoreductase (luciferase family)
MGIYRAALQEYDKEGTVDEFPMRRDVFIAEDRETAMRIVEPVLKSGYRGVRGNPLDVLIVGGPQEFINKIEELQALGTSHLLLRFIVPTQEHILRAIQIIGGRVIPQVS